MKSRMKVWAKHCPDTIYFNSWVATNYKSDFSFTDSSRVFCIYFFLCQEKRDHGNLITKDIFSVYAVGVLKNSKFYWDTIVFIYYTPKYAIWAFEQFDWFTLIILWLHITLIYLLWRVQVAHIAWIYLFWWIRLIRQQFVANCSSSGRCSSTHFASCVLCAACDGFSLKSLKFLLLSYLSSFVYVFKLHWFSSYFQEVHQLSYANWVSTGQTVELRPVVCYWITRFYESWFMESWCRGGKRKDLNIGE